MQGGAACDLCKLLLPEVGTNNDALGVIWDVQVAGKVSKLFTA